MSVFMWVPDISSWWTQEDSQRPSPRDATVSNAVDFFQGRSSKVRFFSCQKGFVSGVVRISSTVHDSNISCQWGGSLILTVLRGSLFFSREKRKKQNHRLLRLIASFGYCTLVLTNTCAYDFNVNVIIQAYKFVWLIVSNGKVCLDFLSQNPSMAPSC